jgi:hypothetical protein
METPTLGQVVDIGSRPFLNLVNRWLARQRGRAGGVVAAYWPPGTRAVRIQAVARALTSAWPYNPNFQAM